MGTPSTQYSVPYLFHQAGLFLGVERLVEAGAAQLGGDSYLSGSHGAQAHLDCQPLTGPQLGDCGLHTVHIVTPAMLGHPVPDRQ